MEQIPSGEANSHSAILEIPRLFIETKGSLSCSQEPDAEPDEPNPHPPIVRFPYSL